jgi:hypothetical protein
MTSKKPVLKIVIKQDKIVHPGMLGDGTEEQNLNEAGDPSRRVKKDDVEAAFDKAKAGKS